MTKYKLQVFKNSNIDFWDDFVQNSNNGTIFHSLAFLSYHGNRFLKNINHLAWYNGNTLEAVMPLAVFMENGKRIARSPFGASFGGLVFKKELKLKYAIEITKSFINYLKTNSINECFITPTPLYFFDTDCNYFDQTLFARGFSLLHREICHVLKLPKKQEEIWACFDSKCRNQVRNGLKNFKITKNINPETFYPILLEDKQRHNNAVPTHTLCQLKYLKQKLADKILFDIAIGKNDSKAGTCYFKSNKTTLTTFYTAQESGALGINGMNALIMTGLQRAVKEGYRFFDFGTSSYHNKSRNLNLSQFKESFGARGYFRDTYHWVNQ